MKVYKPTIENYILGQHDHESPEKGGPLNLPEEHTPVTIGVGSTDILSIDENQILVINSGAIPDGHDPVTIDAGSTDYLSLSGQVLSIDLSTLAGGHDAVTIAAASQSVLAITGQELSITFPTQEQADWFEADSADASFILNKPQIPAGPGQYYPDGLISGGLVTWISGYTYLVSAAVYRIGGVVYYSDSMEVTLTAADVLYDRRDVIVVNIDSVASSVTGVPSADPLKPQVDPLTQIELTDVLLLVNSTDPTGGTTITDEIIYNENIEWTPSVSGVSVNFDSTTTPFKGTKCADVGLISNNDTITFSKGSVLNFEDYETLLLNVNLKDPLPDSCSLNVEFLLGGAIVTTLVNMNVNLHYGDVWQGLILPIQAWIQTSQTFDAVRIRWRKTGPDNNAIGFLLDYVKLQSGISQAGTTGTVKLIGDITGQGDLGTEIQTTLATVNANVGSFGTAAKTVTLTVDAKGRITAISENDIPASHDAVTIDIGSQSILSLVGQVLSIDLSGVPDGHPAVTIASGSAALASIGTDQVLTLTEPTWDALPDKPSIPTLDNLSIQALSGTTPSWDASSGMNATLTLSGDTTITLSNLLAGRSGNIKVTNASTAYTLTMSGYANMICPAIYSAENVVKTSGGSSKIDMYSWYYDGTNLIWNGSLDYK